MRGSIKKRGSTYTYVVDIGPDPATGKRRQRTKGGFRTRKECLQALNDVIAAARAGTFVEPAKRTVESFLVQEWLPAVKPPRVRESTWLSYQLNIQNHIVPALGRLNLQALTPGQLTAFYRHLLTSGRRDGKGGLAPKTVKNIHATLHPALAVAMRWGYVVRNVADAVDLPKVSAPEMQVWSPEQLRTFLAHVRADRLFAAWMLFATTGMRRGEVAGLRWTDVDLRAGQVKVAKPRVAVRYQVHVSEPKTLKGKRWLALDPATATALREHRTRQAEERLMVGPGWVDSGLVFTWPDGRELHPERFTRWFQHHAHDAGLPKIRLHDVRHSYATAALAAGVPAKVVSERLGHANIAITMDTYSHVLPGMDERAASAVARLILGDEAAPAEGAVNNL
jgi:integrase